MPDPGDRELLNPPGRGWVTPLHVPGVLVLAAILALSAGRELHEPDAPWHVLLGREILREHTVRANGQSWMLVPVRAGWTTTQWLSEIGMAALVDAIGWNALQAATTVLLGLTFLILAVAVRRAPGWAFFVLTAAAGTTLVTTQARPSTAVLPLLALLGLLSARLLEGQVRRLRVVVPLVGAGSLLAAQLHGTWILAPGALTLVCVGIALDRRYGSPEDVAPPLRPALAALAASFLGVLNPHGLRSFLLPLEFSGSTKMISEWQPTQFTHSYTATVVVLVGVVLLSWARAGRRVPWRELLWLGAWTAFAVMAFRNVTPSLLMLVPFAGAILGRTPNRRTDSPRERRVLGAAIAVLAVAAVAVAGVRLAAQTPWRGGEAADAAAWIAAQPGPVRVFNDYNLGGTLAALGGGNARLAVDGRADLWGEYAERVQNTQYLDTGWEKTLAQARPDALVIQTDSPLAQLVTREGTWRVVVPGGPYEVLVPVK